MVSSLLSDALTDPSAVLQDLFVSSPDLDTFPANVSSHFARVFGASDALKEIPALNLRYPPEAHKDRSLVRFRGMVQDTSPSPQVYLARLSEDKCGGWGLSESEDDPVGGQTTNHIINYSDLRECTVVWAVTIPGESSWCTDVLDAPLSAEQQYTLFPSAQPHKFPIPGALHVGVQVKIYDCPSGELLKPTDLCNFVGIITTEPLLGDLELTTPSLVPTLHVLFSQPIVTTLLPRVFPITSIHEDIREHLISWIADECLAGDRDAAEWVLLCCVAKVHSRLPAILHPTLTLSQFPSPDVILNGHPTPALPHALSYILPMVSTLPISLQVLNTTSFSPESKEEDLHSGWLQLPPGSVCVVTEGGVTEGTVSERGISNIHALQQTMNSQTLEYIFPYSRFIFDVDVNFLVLCEGRKSAFFQTLINIPLELADLAEARKHLYKSPSAIKIPPQDQLEAFRNLLGSAKVGHVNINEETAEYIQTDFVRERQATLSTTLDGKNPTESITSGDLMHRMVLARLLALSLQKAEVTIDVWERTKLLEAKRLERLAQSS